MWITKFIEVVILEIEIDDLVGTDTLYNPQNEMLPFHKTKCSETQNEASSL